MDGFKTLTQTEYCTTIHSIFYCFITIDKFSTCFQHLHKYHFIIFSNKSMIPHDSNGGGELKIEVWNIQKTFQLHKC